jgi:hypothetical protein
MAWWKQALLSAAAFWSGCVFMFLWFTRNFGELGQDVTYVRAGIFVFSAVVFLASALVVANWSGAKQAPQP